IPLNQFLNPLSRFVQEFVSDPYDGVTLLLELLRNIQLSQNGHSGGTTSSSVGSTLARTPPIVQRRALLDELACLQCLLCCCVRYHDAVHSLIASTAGLYTLAVCIMSSVNKSRIIALQLLTKACEASSKGHSAVSEAMTTLRLRYGEPVRFRFLIGMLTSAGGQGDLLAAGMRFINAFLDSAGSTQRRLYVQAELEQAGFDIAIIKKIIPINSPSTEHVFKEFDRWEKNHIDIETMAIRLENSEKDNDNLRDKVVLLERRIQILQEEKGILLSLEQCLKERCSELEREIKSLKPGKTYLIKTDCSLYRKDRSTPADDEGISSSERSLTPEDEMRNETSVCSNYNQTASTIPKDKHSEYHNSDEEETTIEEVIEELQNIVNKEETNNYIEANKSKLILSNDHNISRVNSMTLDPVIFDDEMEIIPTNIHPHPPRRVKSLVQMFLPTDDYGYTQENIYMDNGTPFTSEEGSDSLLSASKCHPQRVGSTANCKNTTIIKLNSENTPDQKIYDQIYSTTYEPINNKPPQSFGVFFNSVKSLNDNLHHDFAAASTTLSKQTKKRLMTARQRAVNKIKSKSLDRIEDGLDAMVDIIVTDRKLNLQKDLQNELTANHSQYIKSNPGSQKSEETCKVILPKDQSQYFPQVNEKCSNNGSFVVKRGYNNVGLYSSCNLTKTTLSVPAPPKIETYCHKKVNRLHSVSKLADLPSGLY
ncbi:uncharacterized protein LOC108741227, partial [Agrilus planipennis]|uniref:Uncharacterized protein LOC108741227 n=1 Tax=Agrilus planipennis TaxID=224129 RepID=A0A1W4X5S0_AGRPL